MPHSKTGLKEFNEIIPGLPTASAVLLQGAPGAGKTIFGFALMDVKDKAKKIVVLTNNTPAEISEEITSFKAGFEATYIDCYSWLSGAPAAVDSLANLGKITFLIEDALEEGSILLFDSLTPLLLYSSDEEIQRFMQQVIAIAKAKSSIILFTLDLGTYPSDAENTFRSLCDGVIHLDKEKGLRILKMRDTKVPSRDFFYEVAAGGFRLRSGKPRSGSSGGVPAPEAAAPQKPPEANAEKAKPEATTGAPKAEPTKDAEKPKAAEAEQAKVEKILEEKSKPKKKPNSHKS